MPRLSRGLALPFVCPTARGTGLDTSINKSDVSCLPILHQPNFKHHFMLVYVYHESTAPRHVTSNLNALCSSSHEQFFHANLRGMVWLRGQLVLYLLCRVTAHASGLNQCEAFTARGIPAFFGNHLFRVFSLRPCDCQISPRTT